MASHKAFYQTEPTTYSPNQRVDILSSPQFTSVYTDNIDAENDLTIYTGTNKTLVLDHPVFNDINIGINPRNTGTGRPTLATFKGGILEFQFAVGDFVSATPFELLHDWVEGSTVEFHLHWAMSENNDATVRGVKWAIEFTYADAEGVFVNNDTQSVEAVIPANELAHTHRYTSIFSFTPATKIGTQVCLNLTRIASVTNPAPATSPFALSFGVHYSVNSLGSRTRGNK